MESALAGGGEPEGEETAPVTERGADHPDRTCWRPAGAERPAQSVGEAEKLTVAWGTLHWYTGHDSCGAKATLFRPFCMALVESLSLRQFTE